MGRVPWLLPIELKVVNDFCLILCYLFLYLLLIELFRRRLQDKSHD